jgi:SpoIIAA-like
MLNVQFNGDVLVVRPDGPITREDVATLTDAADEYLASHSKIVGVMVETRTFPGFASVGAFADYAGFITAHHARVRRVALVTDSALAPVAEFMANHVVGLQMRHYPFAEGAAAQAWLRSP